MCSGLNGEDISDNQGAKIFRNDSEIWIRDQ